MTGDLRAAAWLLHGAAFLALALVGALLPRGVTVPRFAASCRAIAGFGALVGAASWLVLLDPNILPGGNGQASGLGTARLVLLAAAFAVLLRDGLRAHEGARALHLDLLPLLGAGLIALVSLLRPSHNAVLEVTARYLLALPAALLEARVLAQSGSWSTAAGRSGARDARIAAWALVGYGVLAALAVPSVAMPPASLVNAPWLARLLGVPAQLPMALAAVVISIGLSRAIGAMRLEAEALLAESRERLEARVAERTASLKQANSDLARQIGARERMEAAWHESEADLAITLHSLGEAVITTTASGQVARMNPAAERLTGLTIEDALGRPLADLITVIDEQANTPMAERLRAALQGASGEALPAEAVLVAAGGVKRQVGISCAPILHNRHHAYGQKRLGTVIVLRDVGERRKLEERVRLSDRLVSLGTMASGVAHEINNPLTYVTLNVDLVMKELATLRGELSPTLDGGLRGSAMAAGEISARLAELVPPLSEAQEGASRVRRIVRDLKLFSRSDEDVVGRIDVRRTVEAACSMAWNEVRHRARLSKHLGEVVPVEANEARLGQVIVSLLMNAAQAIPEGRAERNTITVTTGTTGVGSVYIEVRDTGCGIPPENLSRLFDPFFTTKPVGSGTGLGLAVCHGIVRGLGGHIVVDSEVGTGSLFRIELPAAKALESEIGSATPSLPEPGRRARVLLVDDEVMILRTLRRSIGRDTDLVALTRAEEALELIKGGERFDLILCDLMMPTMTGMELFEELGRCAPDQAERVVFVTGGAFTSAAQEFLARVPNPQLGKPVDLVELKALITARLGNPPPQVPVAA